MLTINGVEVHTSVRLYTCLDCDWTFPELRNRPCPYCGSTQVVPTQSIKRRATFKWQERYVTDAPFTTG